MYHGELRIFALESTREFGEEVCRNIRHKLRSSIDKNFPDGESYAQPAEDVRGKDVFVIQSLHNLGEEKVDTKLAKLIIYNIAALRASAGRITNVIPYHAYTRQDRKAQSRAPLSFKAMAKALVANGANRILSMDWHNPAVENAYDIPVDLLSPVKEITSYLKTRLEDEEKIVALAPDVGATSRNEYLAHRLSKSLEREVDLAVTFKKRKDEKQTNAAKIIGDVDGAIVIIYDDESVTGSSLIGAFELAKKMGAKRGIAIVTHGKFTDDGVSRLENSDLEEIIVTDTVWRPDSFFKERPKFTNVSVAQLFGEAIRRIHNSESISCLFDE